MIVAPNGQPVSSEGPTGKSITIFEHVRADGKKSWGVEFAPDLRAFEFEEVIQILADVTRGIALQARQRRAEAKILSTVQEKMNAMSKEMEDQ